MQERLLRRFTGSLIKTVIFDLDGTLIDTEKYYRRFWPLACEAYGYHMTDEQALQCRSLGRPFALVLFREWFGEEFDYWKVRSKRKELMEAELADKGIELKPGCVEILNWLRDAGYETAICTANDLERATRYLKQLHLDGYFDKIICATMVERGKPAPDSYIYACAQLGRKPEECMAVEDSPNGVNSAYGAGCRVVLVPDQDQPDEELMKKLYAKADCLLDIREILRK